MVIGLTGKSCAGKDEGARFLSSKGIAVIDVDRLGHEALAVNRDRLVAAFGEGILDADGNVNRRVLGSIVFSSHEKLEILNGISHPWMKEKVVSFIKDKAVCAVNCALLEKMDLVNLCDEILYFYAPLDIRIQRAEKRDGIGREAFLRRNESQNEIGTSLFESGKKVITILNDSDKEYLYRQLASYYDTLLSRGYIYG